MDTVVFVGGILHMCDFWDTVAPEKYRNTHSPDPGIKCQGVTKRLQTNFLFFEINWMPSFSEPAAQGFRLADAGPVLLVMK